MPSDVSGSSVLIVDDAPENLRVLVRLLRAAGLVPRPVPDGRLAIEAALADPPDLILMDIRMPGLSGFDVCRQMKQNARLRDIPVVFMSGLQGFEEKIEAFRVGGVDYVSKPFNEEELLARTTTHLHLRRLQLALESHNTDLERRVAEQVKATTGSQLATIFALAKLAEARDDDTGHHVERVQTFAQRLAEQMAGMGLAAGHLTPEFIDTLYQTASLHDLGKVAVRDAVLLKPGQLDAAEFAEMQEHCALGANTLAAVLERHPDNQFLRMGVDVARSHHERWDGGGYPDGLVGEAIPLAARIVAVADVYDALTSGRCYRDAFSHEQTCAMLHEGDGTHFDPDVLSAFRVLEDELQRTRQEMSER